MDERTAQLLALVRDDTAPPGVVGEAWRALFDRDPTIGASAAFDLLAGEPRIKPSRRLTIDPGDSARRRWDRRVASAAALLASPLAPRVFEELRDELAEDPDLAADVLTVVVPHDHLSGHQRVALSALSRPAGPATPGT